MAGKISFLLVILSVAMLNALPPTLNHKGIRKKHLSIFQNLKKNGSSKFDPEVLKTFLSKGLNLTRIMENCPPRDLYYSFSKQHREAVKEVSDFLRKQSTSEEMINMIRTLRDQPEIHPKVWYTALVEAAFDRQNLTGFQPAAPEELFPSTFVPYKVINKACRTGTIGENSTESPVSEDEGSSSTCSKLDETIGFENGPENLLWYFREDMQLNANHWLWHAVYPGDPPKRPDRRGELFYYFHSHFISRYIAERITQGLPPLVPIDISKDSVIEQGYKSFLNDTISGREWSNRRSFSKLELPIPQPGYDLLLKDITRARNNVLESLKKNRFLAINGTQIKLTPTEDRIDMLAQLLEAENSSINPLEYGLAGIHGYGHLISAWAGIPFLVAPPNVMGDVATAVRDVLFYRWHMSIDQIFKMYKAKLDPYPLTGGRNQLVFENVKLTKLEVTPESKKKLNELTTFWSWRNFTLSRAADFTERDENCPVPICAKHLDHEEFNYHLQIQNGLNKKTKGTIRIFMAPRFRDSIRRIQFEEQRELFFPMDSFSVILHPGMNHVTRHSTNSSFTIPFLKTLSELESDLDKKEPTQSICGCGWPHHLLLPKGNPRGAIFDLFVMVTNGDEDAVDDPMATEEPACYTPYIACGFPGRKYPDARPMGYPFDRKGYTLPLLAPAPPPPPPSPISGPGPLSGPTFPVPPPPPPAVLGTRSLVDLEEFVANIPNSRSVQVKIVHRES